MQQELHHVRLSEELGDRGQFVRSDLDLGAVDLLLLLGLPELIDPPERVRGRKHLGRQPLDQAFELQPVLAGELHIEYGVIRSENLR